MLIQTPERLQNNENISLSFWLNPSRAGSTSSYAIQPERTKDQAVDLFNSFHRKNVLSPNALLKQHKVALVFLPFWIFEVQGKLQYTATLGDLGADRSSQKVVTGTGHDVTTRALDKHAQVAASYELRRDLANGLKSALQTNAWYRVPRQFSAKDAQALLRVDPKCNTRILPADMHRGIAWALFLRALRHEHVCFRASACPGLRAQHLHSSLRRVASRTPLAGTRPRRLAEARA